MDLDLLHRLERFLHDPEAARFDDLAREAFAYQVEHVPPVAALATSRGVSPSAIAGWRDVPAVPALAFKTVDLSPGVGDGDGSVETFRSSGTTGRARSVHRHAFPDLYREVIDASFPRFCLPGPPAGDAVPMLSLIPRRRDLPDSSLSFMVDHVMRRWAGWDRDDPDGGSVYAFGAGGLDPDLAARWVARRERDGRPGVVLATAFALAAWLEELEVRGARRRLPEGTVVFETGGFKGRTRELRRDELLRRIEERLGVPPERVVREYGMTELTSQLYTDVLAGGDRDLFVAPHWVRVRVLDPETLAEAPPGETGLIAVFDLANLSSTVHLLTEDLGSLLQAAGAIPAAGSGTPAGLRLLGRAAGAELRGCSLAAEEMAGAARTGSTGGTGDAR